MKHTRPALAIVACAVVGLAADAPSKRPVTAEDYYAFKNVTDARISPDGKLIAYSVNSVDQKRNRRNTDIWMIAVGGSRSATQFTSGYSSRAPRWKPDGHELAFLSIRPSTSAAFKHSDRAQVYALSMNGGEPRQLTDLENGVDAFQWSPTGDRLVCVSKTGPARRPFDQGGSDVRHYTSITYKYNDTGWYDERRSHLFVIDSQGRSVQLTSGQERTDTDPQWSPDGTRIAFMSDDTTQALLMNNDIWVIPSGGGQMTRLTRSSGSARPPRWSPDGTRVAYAFADSASDLPKTYISPASGGTAVLASKELDLQPTTLEWESEQTLFLEAQSHGETHLFQLDLRNGHVSPVTRGARAIHTVDRNSKAGVMVYTSDDFEHPDDLYMSDLAGGGEKRLTEVNHDVLAQLDIQKVERFTFEGAEGWAIDGFLVKPANWQAGKKYPMVVSIHGGPNSMYGVDWFHEFQVYASRGWAVLFMNPRGSGGYGEKFQRAVEKEWGGKAYTDLMNGVDAALAKYPWVDKDHLGVTGGSYGGFMTNWIVGHTTRFKAAVTLRSISNFMSVEGTRDAAYSHARDFGTNLFDDTDLYWKSSPIRYAKDVRTPTLVMHSDNDYRVPIEQGEQWFRALKLFGVTTELVIFPRENHNLTRTGEPRHIAESINWQLYWFDRFLNGNAAAIRPNER